MPLVDARGIINLFFATKARSHRTKTDLVPLCVCGYSLCLTTSNIKTVPAALAFSDSASPGMVMLTLAFANSRACSLAPSASPPMINASGSRKSVSQQECPIHIGQEHLQTCSLANLLDFIPVHCMDRQPEMRTHSRADDLWRERHLWFREAAARLARLLLLQCGSAFPGCRGHGSGLG